ncbi:ComEC/Rec2 family competence protein [Mycoplasma sp. Ms02]|uniref:ComEC/Rec2 family competence protein n=1 Tax=Mycoplasma sp. Ms02 TaxID=353851 RepID=UPI001C895CD6|nr:ComEC/Rec2 family competence protein [Mycoplasma sp. Ms02]QZE12605.1 ComEC/Rec2 family competence protein [Mycoplasma sp. Ms02]
MLLIVGSIFLTIVLLQNYYYYHYKIGEKGTFYVLESDNDESFISIDNRLFYTNRKNLISGEVYDYKGFSSKGYFSKSSFILDFLSFKTVRKSEKTFWSLFTLKNQLIPNYIKNSYAYSLIFGHSPNKQVSALLQNLGIFHLFVISGFHFITLEKILGYIFKNRKYGNFYTLSILIFYFLICKIGVSSLRIITSKVLGFFSRKVKIEVSAVNLETVCICILFLINPWFLLSPGFWLSCGLSSLIQKRYQKEKDTKQEHWLKSYLKTNFIAFTFMSPVLWSFSKEVNLLAILTCLIFTPVIQVVYICSIIFITIPQVIWALDKILFLMLKGFSDYLSFLVIVNTRFKYFWPIFAFLSYNFWIYKTVPKNI